MLQMYLLLHLFTFLSFFSRLGSTACGADTNPYCTGVAAFTALCCGAPNVCYWSNRDGTPACCAAGQDCRLNGGPGPSSVYTTYYPQATTSAAVFTQVVGYTSTVTNRYTSTASVVVQQSNTQVTSVHVVTTNEVVVVTQTVSDGSAQAQTQTVTSGGGSAVNSQIGIFVTGSTGVPNAAQSSSSRGGRSLNVLIVMGMGIMYWHGVI